MTIFNPGKIVIPDTPVPVFKSKYKIPEIRTGRHVVIRQYDTGIYRVLYYRSGIILYLKIEDNKWVYLKRIWSDGTVKNHDSLVDSIDVLTYQERTYYRIRGIDLWELM